MDFDIVATFTVVVVVLTVKAISIFKVILEMAIWQFKKMYDRFIKFLWVSGLHFSLVWQLC